MSQAILDALGRVIDPELRRPIPELGMVEVSDSHVKVKLTVVGCPAASRIEADARAALTGFDVSLEMTVMTAAERDQLKAKLRNGVAPRTNPFGENSLTKIFLIGSGKGGVGKSTITTNLAIGLAKRGFKVGLIDADIFGFSIPGQLGLIAKPTRVDDMILPPVFESENCAVKVISIGMFVSDNQPVAWRGPMLHRAIEQFLVDVYWGDLDFLLVDLPPGTGDVAISLGQQLPTAKSIVVTTPQQAAAEVAERSASVGLQTGQKIFGVIENMSWFEAPDGEKIDLFGRGGGAKVAARLAEISGSEVKLLAQIPLSVPLRSGSDLGEPLLAARSDDSAAVVLESVVDQMIAESNSLAGKKIPLNLV